MSWIRSCHWAQYRRGEWARIVMVVEARERPCYLVEFIDGATDLWVVDDPAAAYEFAESVDV